MLLTIIENNSTEYAQMILLRKEILRWPLGLDLTEEDLKNEEPDIKIGAFENKKILGCCVLTKMDDKTIRLRQMAVANEFQGSGIGRALMSFAEKTAQNQGYKILMMHARKTAIGFYEKLGYIVVGKEFEEVSIPHFSMQKEL
jgi:ribosomal protein S18 acetylase RimI-like enzyme